MRRKHIRTVRCAHEGCRESARYEYDTAREYKEAYARQREWRCNRHRNPEELLGMNNLETRIEMTAKRAEKYPDLEGLFWNGTNGFVFGSGYKAFAKDFPPGTKLIVTAQIQLPMP